MSIKRPLTRWGLASESDQGLLKGLDVRLAQIEHIANRLFVISGIQDLCTLNVGRKTGRKLLAISEDSLSRRCFSLFELEAERTWARLGHPDYLCHFGNGYDS
jgi:hypothetical protein